MQFALIEAFNKLSIVSAYESYLIHHFPFQNGITVSSDMGTLCLDDSLLTICYGKFICQEYLRDSDTIPNTITENCNTGLFCIVNDDVEAQTIEIGLFSYAAIKLYERDSLGNIPFAALIYGEQQAMDKIQGNNQKSFAIECSYRRSEEVLLNVFNRIGIFAIKSTEKRIPKNTVITRENWFSYVDDNRAVKTAANIQ